MEPRQARNQKLVVVKPDKPCRVYVGPFNRSEITAIRKLETFFKDSQLLRPAISELCITGDWHGQYALEYEAPAGFYQSDPENVWTEKFGNRLTYKVATAEVVADEIPSGNLMRLYCCGYACDTVFAAGIFRFYKIDPELTNPPEGEPIAGLPFSKYALQKFQPVGKHDLRAIESEKNVIGPSGRTLKCLVALYRHNNIRNLPTERVVQEIASVYSLSRADCLKALRKIGIQRSPLCDDEATQQLQFEFEPSPPLIKYYADRGCCDSLVRKMILQEVDTPRPLQPKDAQQ